MRIVAPVLVAAGILAGAAAPGLAQSGPLPGAPSQQTLGGARLSCTATNGAHDQQCSVACQPGQSADCEDGEASDTPTCLCGVPGADTP